MGTLGNKPVTTFQALEKQSITGNAGTTYALDHSVTNANDLEVFVNNVRQEPTTAYTISGQNIVMSEAIASTDSFYVIYQSQAFSKAVPVDTSITTAMLQDDAVTSAKLQNSAVTDAKIGTMAASKLTGALPAISGASLSATGGIKSVQLFASAGSHTYTKPSGVSKVRVIVTGGGGGGGGHGAANDYGAGGGAGGTSIKLIDVTSISTVAVNVGAAGTAGSAGGDNGGGGGGSSFGSHATGNGGDGGYHGNAGPVKGGDGGSASGGHINITGGDGINGVDNDFVPSGNNYRSSYGNGGSSYWGGGGRGSAYNQGPQAGKAYGSGGGGSGSPASSFNGGAGMNGVVFVEEFS